MCIQFWHFDAHQVLLTLFCVVFGVASVSSIVQFIPESASGYYAAMEVFRLVDQVSQIDATQPTGQIETFGDGSIEFQNVNFWYPHRQEVRVLKKLSFTIEKGQSVALVGFSGSGKSTVIQLLQRFYDPQAGAILVGGQDLRQLNVAYSVAPPGLQGPEKFNTFLSTTAFLSFGHAAQSFGPHVHHGNRRHTLTSFEWEHLAGACKIMRRP